MVARGTTHRTQTHLTPFLKGAIFGLLLAGWTYTEIANEIEKPDGTRPSQQAIANVDKQVKSRGGFAWDGAHSAQGVGRPRETTDALDKAIRKVVFKYRGRKQVNINFIQKVLKATRKLSRSTVARRLGEAGLAWLRRRHKTLVPAAHKVSRLDWAAWVLARNAATLARWAYSDGTVFYLGRCESQQQSNNRGALGAFVWRYANGSDGLFEDCVGPSSYWKAQGMPVRVWGLLVAGVLFIWILPEEWAMTGERYAWVIEHKFRKWAHKALGRKARQGVFLVQDHERALWTDLAREAMDANGFNLLEHYPKCSQDLNPIETAWRELRARLYVTQPVGRESRVAFIRRLRTAVAWLNVNRTAYFAQLCSSQKERARDVQKQMGGRTKH